MTSMVIGEHNVKNREDDDDDYDDDYDDDDVDDEVDVDALCMSECDHHISSKDTTALSSVPSHIHNKTQLYTSIRVQYATIWNKQCPAGRVFQYQVGSGIGQNIG